MTSLAPLPHAKTGPGGRAGRAMDPARRVLRSLRERARTLLLVEGISWTVAILGALLTAEILVDAALRMPAGLRWVILIAGTGAGVWLVRRWVLPAVSFKPGLTRMALRLERVVPAESALAGTLASAMELDRNPPENPVTRAMARRAIERAAASFTALGRYELLNTRPALRAFGACVAVVALGGTLAAMNPQGAETGLTRALAPWAGAEWPKRTEIVDATGREVHPADVALPVRGALTRTNRAAGETRVELTYRVGVTTESGRRVEGPERTAVLAPQRRRLEVGGVEAEVYERLIDPSVFGSMLSGAEGERTLTYTLSTEDDRTERATVLLVDPPRLVGATAEIEPPAYAAGSGALASGTIDLGRGNDERAIVGPVLAGSVVRLRAEYSTPIELNESALRRTAEDLSDADAGARVETDERSIVIELVPGDSARVPLRPVDRYGFAPREEAVLTLDVVPDRDPSPAVVEPARDEAVLATAVIAVRAEASDDIGVRSLTLERAAARRSGESAGAEAVVDGEPVELAAHRGAAEPGQSAEVGVELDLSVLGVTPGDEVWLTATAEDARAPEAGRVVSPVRRLIIIDEGELVEQLRARLEQVRRATARLDERQGELSRALPEDGAPPESLGRDQATLTDRLGEQRRAVEALAERQERNALRDEALEDLIGDAQGHLAEAARASARAAEAANAGENQRAEDEQREVRQEIGRLLELLDRGEDSWVVRRSLERLLEDQRRLESDTQRAGEGTAGRSAEQLTPEERTALERIAERQRELAERAERAIDELAERADELEGQDPGQSQALEEAASAGRQSRVGQQLREAAQSAQQNRTADAGRQQEEAREAIEEMLERLDQADRLRDRALQRILATLVEKLEALIAAQERELDRLITTRGVNQPVAPLDRAMIDINARTLAAIAEAAGGPPEAKRLAEPLGEAGQAQVEAIDALRANDADTAEVAERRSLAKLKDALEIAQQEQEDAEQREQRRVLAEIRAAYRAALDAQNALIDATRPFVGEDLNRRDRATVRGLAGEQEAVRGALAEVLTNNPQLAEAPVVALIHERLDSVTAGAAERLGRGVADAGTVARQEQAVKLLRSLIEHLSENRPQNDRDDNFQNGGGGGGGGGGGNQQDAPLVELLAELRMLRDLQAVTAELTRSTADAQADAAPADPTELGTLQRRIAEQGADLVKRLQEQNQPGGGGGGGAPEPRPQPDAEGGGPDAGPGELPEGGGGGEPGPAETPNSEEGSTP
jgi:hypothetical protein